ncbi:MAG: hypothetical protein ORN98_02425 [Alphaproteobacteria bacterium]|nr:hypothetical protein [Alphaproteobacteria bacterium]
MNDKHPSQISTQAKARQNMVESQIRTNKVINPDLIAALSVVARENFVPRALCDVAYIDEDLPIGHGRYLLEPMVFARLLESANLASNERVLDFGCGCGYSSAVLARLVDRVQPVDWQADFIAQSIENLAKSGSTAQIPILVKLPPKNGAHPVPALPELSGRGVFDVIFVEVALGQIPHYLLNLLSKNGRLIAIERKSLRIGVGHAILVQRINESEENIAVANMSYLRNSSKSNSAKGHNGVFSRRVLFDAAAPLLPEFMPIAEFQF